MYRKIKSLISTLLQILLGFAIGGIIANLYIRTHSYEIVPNVVVLELGPSCALDIHYPPAELVRTITLSCAHTDQIRLWPLPIKQPWHESENNIYLETGRSAPPETAPISAAP